MQSHVFIFTTLFFASIFSEVELFVAREMLSPHLLISIPTSGSPIVFGAYLLTLA